MTFLADFEVQEVAQELLASQGAPATAENLSRAMNAIIADPNVARATHSGSQLYAERVEQRLAPSVDRYSTGPVPDAASGIDLTGHATGDATSQRPPSNGTAPANGTGSPSAPNQQVPQGARGSAGSGADRSGAAIPLSGNGAAGGSGSGSNAATLPSDIPTIPGTTGIADTEIDNARDGFGLMELLLGGAGAGAAAAGFNAYTEPRAARPGQSVNIPAQDVAINNAREGEFIPGAARGTPQIGAPQGPGWQFNAPMNQLDNLTGEPSAPTSSQGGPLAPTGGSGPSGTPNSGGNGNAGVVLPNGRQPTGSIPGLTPDEMLADIQSRLGGGGQSAPTPATTFALPPPAPAAAGADMGLDVPTPPEAQGTESSVINEQEQANRKIDVARRGGQKLVNDALGQNALEVDYDGSTFRVLAPGPDGAPVLVGNYRNLNMLRNDLGRLRKEISDGKVATRAPELRGGTPPSLEGSTGMPGDGEMDLIGDAKKPDGDKLAHVKDIQKYEAALRERIAAGEGNQAENQKELRQVQAALKRLSGAIR